MLQKGFFLTDSFNPEPYWTNPIVDLKGAQLFDQNTVFIPGVYLVDVQAGSASVTSNGSGKSGRIQTEISVLDPFIIRAYCGSRGTSSLAGRNPYVGAFKVNASDDHSSATPAVTHIFGNRGSTYRYPSGYLKALWQFTSGNCLGDGIFYSGSSLGAGSCLHLLPVDGIFGTDYLFAFHCTAGTSVAKSGSLTFGGGVGSAYGGAGSGAVRNQSGSGSPSGSITSFDGGSTPYGAGGAGVTVAQGAGTAVKGNNGSGPGYGYGGGVSPDGAGAWFNGTTWVDSRTTGGVGEDGHIIVKYLGPLQ